MPAKKSQHSQSHKTENPHEIVTLLEWSAPGRPYKKRTKQFYLTALLIMLLFEIIAFLFSQYLVMLLILSIVFVAFALSSVPPREFGYRISSEGITVEDRFFLWKELYDFYFKSVEGVNTVQIRTEAFLPGVLILTLGDTTLEEVKKALLPYLPYREYIKPTFVEKAADWLSRNFPLENK